MTGAADDLAPLRWPGGSKPPEPVWVPSLLAAILFGSFLAGFVHRSWWFVLAVAAWWSIIKFHLRSRQPVVEQISRQLRARPRFDAAAWGTPARAEMAAWVGRVISEEAGWPNAHYVPDDPLEVAMFNPAGDGADHLVLAAQILKKFGPAIRPRHASDTLGEFVDQLLEVDRAATSLNEPNTGRVD